MYSHVAKKVTKAESRSSSKDNDRNFHVKRRESKSSYQVKQNTPHHKLPDRQSKRAKINSGRSSLRKVLQKAGKSN